MNKTLKKRIRKVITELKDKAAPEAEPLVKEAERLFGEARHEIADARRLSSEKEACLESMRRTLTGEQQRVQDLSDAVKHSKRFEKLYAEASRRLMELENAERMRLARYPTLTSDEWTEWMSTPFTFGDARHTQLRCKCQPCGLEFCVFTWHAEQLLNEGLSCPECRSGEDMLILGRPVSTPIFAEFSTLNDHVIRT